MDAGSICQALRKLGVGANREWVTKCCAQLKRANGETSFEDTTKSVYNAVRNTICKV